MKVQMTRSMKAGLMGLFLALCSGSEIEAAVRSFDFDSDPAGELDITITSNNPGVWKSTGGNPGGYLSLTDAVGGQSTVIIVDGIDAGPELGAITVSMDVRLGNGSSMPADGFSISFPREGDSVGSVDEKGTSTGLAIDRQPVAANIAIIDTGLQQNHPDLNVDLDPGGVRFFFTSVKGKTVIASDSKWDDDNGHGTHVGGTAAANGQIVGIAPGARLTAVKVLNSNGSGNFSLFLVTDQENQPVSGASVSSVMTTQRRHPHCQWNDRREGPF
jgi:hypothetical protein